MKYTVRFAHLSEFAVDVGDTLAYGQRIGKMGNTGSKDTGIHLHIDCVEGEINQRYTLADMMDGRPKPSQIQLDFFIDHDLFHTRPEITTPYLDPDYKTLFGKDHPAIDVVPHDRHETRDHYGIYWNRSRLGRVIRIDRNDPGYGNCVYVCFST